jgi:hypothetical protein
MGLCHFPAFLRLTICRVLELVRRVRKWISLTLLQPGSNTASLIIFSFCVIRARLKFFHALLSFCRIVDAWLKQVTAKDYDRVRQDPEAEWFPMFEAVLRE